MGWFKSCAAPKSDFWQLLPRTQKLSGSLPQSHAETCRQSGATQFPSPYRPQRQKHKRKSKHTKGSRSLANRWIPFCCHNILPFHIVLLSHNFTANRDVLLSARLITARTACEQASTPEINTQGASSSVGRSIKRSAASPCSAAPMAIMGRNAVCYGARFVCARVQCRTVKNKPQKQTRPKRSASE